ncbi:hypothetical protein CI109_100907 [Kwoniella shandongensis]|uniref:Uncharacterized protein n=1 Tax=Kwoniella shandongensis TaxID=1734106 RepID=A0A5M6C8A0_9TREE|nr:uncharacterized protein CI109_001374 [Kwoniella shandongensis]KAA5529972.1 hypothetical protein CI109_001374 [Kwoniella shandongensis]
MSCIYGRGDDLWEIPLHFEPLVKSEKGDDELRGTIEITLTAGEYEKAEMRKIESDATAMAVDVQHDIETGNPKTKQKRRGRVIKDLKVQTYLFVRSYEPESAVSYSFIYNYLPVLSLGNEGAMKII